MMPRSLIALICTVAALALPVSASAALGSLSTTLIGHDAAYQDSTGATWNPHLPKFATYKGWEYAVYSSFPDGANYRYRRAWILKKRTTGRKWRRTGRYVVNFANLPGLTIDRAGRLHLMFNCASSSSCTKGGARGGGVQDRFYDLIFTSLKKNGSFDLRSKDYSNSNEWTRPNCGYAGLGTDPSSASGATYASLSFNDSGSSCYQLDGSTGHQWMFKLGARHPRRVQAVRGAWGAWQLYPQLAFSPTGTRYEVGSDYTVDAAHTDWNYAGFQMSRWTRTGATGVLDKHITDADATHQYGGKFAFPYDMAFDTTSRAYLLYGQEDGSCTDYIVKETTPGSGDFGSPIDAGCHDRYAQLQIDSSNRLYIVESNYRDQVHLPASQHVPKLLVSSSADGGATWSQASFTIPTSGAPGLPAGDTDAFYPTLLKPWSDPHGFRRNSLHGFVAGVSRTDPQISGPDDLAYSANSMLEFEIPLS
jgi:hypothetical protein